MSEGVYEREAALASQCEDEEGTTVAPEFCRLKFSVSNGSFMN